ncbi:MAG: M3 family metallopeptidase [Comamonadaceae bacterium]|nr:M3 family metallopeptidase [Comamonadaceae bacterium]
MENWVLEPELLNVYAKHYQTGEVIPAALVEKLEKRQPASTRASPPPSTWPRASSTWPGTRCAPAEALRRHARSRTGSWTGIGLIPDDRAALPLRPTSATSSAAGTRPATTATSGPRCWTRDAYEAFKEKGIFDRATAESFRKNVLEPVRHRGDRGPVPALPGLRAQDRRAAQETAAWRLRTNTGVGPGQ